MPSPIVEGWSGAALQIDYDHYKIHKGKMFGVGADTASLASGASETQYITTPGGPGAPMVHLRPIRFSSTANSLKVTITEGAVMTGGTAVVPFNLNRQSSVKSKVVAATAATIGTAGTQIIYTDQVGSGGASNRSGGASNGGDERVLKPSTTYSITFTNSGATTATVGTYMIFWYES